VEKFFEMIKFKSLLVLFLWLLGIPGMMVKAASDPEPESTITVPILLYHHVTKEKVSDRYNVTPKHFQEQMEVLKKLGYQTITIKRLSDVLSRGGTLPDRPVVITFDDGNLDNYENAYPVMKKLGFVGSVYIVSNRLKSDGFLQKKQLAEMIEDGWEVGSHSLSHADLVQNHAMIRQEVLQSRLDLEKALDIKVYSFAYPFGLSDWYVSKKVYEYGYKAGLGVGTSYNHSQGTVYNLSRREVYGDYDLEEFKALIPWLDPPLFNHPLRNIPR
jgi:peptidoglycan/xylan/chitin deacetylase (PgdA/CDA1 family)